MKRTIKVFVLFSFFLFPYSVFSEDDSVMEVEEILVTARNREENLLCYLFKIFLGNLIENCYSNYLMSRID